MSISCATQSKVYLMLLGGSADPSEMRETWVRSLGWEDPLEKGKAAHFSILAWRIPWTTVHGITKSQTQLSDFHFYFHIIYLDFLLFSRIVEIMSSAVKVLGFKFQLTVFTVCFLGSKITADCDCSHEIKRRLLLGRKVMTNL